MVCTIPGVCDVETGIGLCERLSLSIVLGSPYYEGVSVQMRSALLHHWCVKQPWGWTNPNGTLSFAEIEK